MMILKREDGLNGVYLPSGPAQQLENVLSCVDTILSRVC